jgi:hypothetical protein
MAQAPAVQAAEEATNMSTRTLNHSLLWWILGAILAAVVWILATSVAGAGTKVHTATRTVDPVSIGPSDAPVRMAVFTSSDRDELKVEPARWWGGWGWGYRAPYYAYYPAPYYYSAPYYTYYAPTPYYTYYTPPTYYSATPYYSYYAPYYQNYAPPIVTYRYPRRAFYGAWYW